MKILCDVHSNSDTAFLDRCAGKDIYVLATIDGPMDLYWIKVTDMTDTFYVCDVFWVTRRNHYDMLNHYREYTVGRSRIHLVQPREILSGNELHSAMSEQAYHEECGV